MKDALTFLYVDELRLLVGQLGLSEKGKKMEFIVRILHFLQTGEKLTTAKMPPAVCAERGKGYPFYRLRIRSLRICG